MARTVSVPPTARVVVFEYLEFDECASTDDATKSLQKAISDYRARALRRFPSMNPASRWLTLEDEVLAENTYALFGVSEYCGLISLWLVPKDTPQDLRDPEAQAYRENRDAWFDQSHGTLLAFFGTHIKVPGSLFLRRIGSIAA